MYFDLSLKNLISLLFSLLYLFILSSFSLAETFYQKNKNGVIYVTNVPPKESGYKRVILPWKNYAKPATRPMGGFKYSDKLDEHINEVAMGHGIDPKLVKAIIKVESNFNPNAVSPKGAMGVMQLMPQTAKRFGVNDPYDPSDNIRGGVKYLKKLSKMFKGDLRLALAGYNAGEEAVIEYGYNIPPYRETIDYVERVIRHYNYLKKKGVIEIKETEKKEKVSIPEESEDGEKKEAYNDEAGGKILSADVAVSIPPDYLTGFLVATEVKQACIYREN